MGRAVGPTLRGERVPWPVLLGYVDQRDGRCIYAYVPGADLCEGRTEHDHVACAGFNAYGKKPPHNERHLVTGCRHHHQGGLATSDRGRAFARDHLATREGACTDCVR